MGREIGTVTKCNTRKERISHQSPWKWSASNYSLHVTGDGKLGRKIGGTTNLTTKKEAHKSQAIVAIFFSADTILLQANKTPSKRSSLWCVKF